MFNFTINPYLRFAIIGVCLILGIVLTVTVNFWYSLPFWLAAIILLVGFILLGTVQQAAKIMQDGDIDAAEKRLAMTWNPNWLFGPSRAVFYILKGTMAFSRKQLKEAEEWLKMAEDINMPSDNESAMVQLQLASLYANKQKWNVAKNHTRKARKLEITNKEIKDQLIQLEQVIKTRGQSHAQYIKQKGKRGQRFHN